MSGIDDLLAESNDRWARAMKKARGVEDLGLGPAVKNYYTRYFPGGALVLLIAGMWVGTLIFPVTPSSWASHLSLGFLFVAAGATIGGLIYNAKKIASAVRLNTVDVLYPLAPEERKSISRQIAGKTPVDKEHLVIVRAGAVQQRKSLATQLVVMPGYLFVLVGQVSGWVGRGDPFLWILAVVTIFGIVAVVLIVRDFKRTTRFLKVQGG